ncbi:polysaccharide biosynthesis C-terminal domain-containing protein [Phytohabitans sp. ZYX-F-186]|uniref:Polysaccharide biosynthesis C-terminal domain-containing protein n=1 Tax=Phytohabitans maris TaxID=3071409 RepID=A0ABU0ZNS2_9ACTN|nr:polysaccharide biosynthesis C-terminal domain-containing protein [Phytohabitans sp. ZYX-F-186]MDQ7908683.1 polysaccharide biosynthesis C-terminal domain-containing protein [Phytohabitans sp. ZYX-F-186]
MTTLAPPRPQRPVEGMARRGLAGIAAAGFSGAAGVVVTLLVARALGAASAGTFFAATAGFVLAGAVVRLGTQTGLVYWVARLRTQERTHLLGACLRIALIPVAAASVALAALLWFVAPAPLDSLALFLPLAAFSDAALAGTRGYRQLRPTLMLERLARPALQVLTIGALAVAAVSTPGPYAAAWVGPYLPVALLAGYALRRAYLSMPTPARRPGHKMYLALRAQFWRYTGPRSVASVAQLALQRVDVLLVAALGGLAAAAVYAVAGRFVVLGQLANQGISQSVQPRLAEALATGDRLTANHLYQIATGWLVLVTWPLYLMVITYAPVYLGLFGDEYQSGGPVVVVLASAMLVATGCGMVDMVLSMAGRTRWNLGNVTAALAVMVVLDLALIPPFGAVGAAIGLAAAVLVNNIAPLVQVGNALGIHPFGPGTVAAAGLAVTCFGVLPQIVAATAGTGPAAVTTAAALAFAGYGAGAWRMRHRLGLARSW